MAVRNITSGELNRRVAILLCSEAANTSFGVDTAYTNRLERWAKHEPINSLTLRAGVQTGESATDLFWIRVGAGTTPYDITASHVIEWNGRRYRVMDTIADGRRAEFTRISAKDLGAI